MKTAIFRNPGSVFQKFYEDFYFAKENLEKFITKMKTIVDSASSSEHPNFTYPLLPLSKGCQMALISKFTDFEKTFSTHILGKIKKLEELLCDKGKVHTSPFV